MEKIIPSHQNYSISDKGVIKNIKSGRILKLHVRPDGYVTTSLYHKGVMCCCYVHRVLLETFFWSSDKQVNHMDGDKSNNSIGNLEYCTPKENMEHAHATSLITIKKKTYEKAAISNRKVNDKDAATMRKLSVDGWSFRRIGKMFGVHHKTVSGIVNQVGEIRSRPDNRNKLW